MNIELKTLIYKDNSQGRTEMAETIDRMSHDGWRLKSKDVSQQNYTFGKTCCLGFIFLPLALLGKKGNIITVIMEREATNSTSITGHNNSDNNPKNTSKYTKHVNETVNSISPIVDRSTTSWYKRWWGIAAILFLLIFVLGNIEEPLDSNINQNTSSQTENSVQHNRQPKISYEIVDSWDIGGLGRGAVIVVDSKHDNDKDLEKLGEQLNEENKENNIALVHVYTNKQAAASHGEDFCGQDASPAFREYNKSWVAIYSKSRQGAEYGILSQGTRNCDPNAENQIKRFSR